MWVAHIEVCELFARSLSEQTGLSVKFTAAGLVVVENALEVHPRFYCSYIADGEELYIRLRIGSDQITFKGPPTAEKIRAQVAETLAEPRSSFMRTVKLLAKLKSPAAPTPADLNPAALRAWINADN